jgi:prepilin-type N-terminal cleavage/methylation domain-containing protein
MIGATEDHGFTLVELLVAMALAMVVFGATLTAFEIFQNNNRFDLLRNEAQDNARNAIDRLAKEFRNVAAPHRIPEVPGSLEAAAPYSILFQTVSSEPLAKESKNPTNAMRVRYCLADSGNGATPSDEILWRQVKTWISEFAPPTPSAEALKACPDETAGDFESKAQLARHITNENGGQNRPAFVYGPTGAGESVAQITSVEPTLYINVNPSQPTHPGETQLTSAISLRNGNRQPIAAFTWKQESLKHVLLNASESQDPDGLALTYKWSEGATVFASTAQVWETETGQLSVGEHTITLEVTDPGGLSSKVSKVVTVK